MTADRLTYVYCIAAREVAAAVRGLDGIEPGAAPYAIEHGRLAAIASDVPAASYGEAALHERLADLEWAGQKGIAHERVVETCFLAGATIPLRFCTIFESPERARAILERYEKRLEAILADLGGKAEFGLRAYVDRPRFEAWWAATQPATATAASAASPGRAYLEKKKAAQDVKKSSSEALSRALGDIFVLHEGQALRAVRQPVGEVPDLALKAAFLVPLPARDAFEAASTHESAQREPQGIKLRLSGPWPPYAFVPPLDGEAAA